MEVDLLVVSYNTKDLLKNLLDTLHADFEPDVWNIHIQDNGSEDGTKEWLYDHGDDYQITTVDFSGNVGYARAINHLATLGNSELLAAVNADTWFTTNHVKEMIQTFVDNPNQAVCGPKQMDDNDTIRAGGITWDREINKVTHRGWALHDPEDSMFKDRIPCWTVSGSLYYTTRSAWDFVTNDPGYQKVAPGAEGGFLPTDHFFEETFYSNFLGHHGYEVWYDGTVETAGHTWGASEGASESSRKHFNKSRDYYVRANDLLGIPHEC